MFWILSFIRWETGTDWEPYLSFFQKNNTLEEFLQTGCEFLYAFINFLIKNVTDDYWVLLLTIGCIIYSLSAPTIYKYSPLPIVSLLVYLMLRKADIFFVRESVALALCFYSVRYIINKRFWGFAFCILLGTLFHKSIIIFLPAFFIFHAEWNYNKSVIYLLLFSLLILVLQNYVLNSIVYVAKFFGEYFLYKAEHYSTDDAEYHEGISTVSMLTRGLFNRGIILAMLLYANKRIKKNTLLKGYTNIYLASLYIYIITLPIGVVLSRLANSYDIFCIPALAFFIQSFPQKQRVPVYLFFYIYMATRFVFGTLLGSYSAELVPYKTIFSF